MKCKVCQKELPEIEFYQSRLKNHQYICKKCFCKREKEYRNKDILSDSDAEKFDRFYGGIKINITNYPQAFEIVKTSGEYYLTKDKNEFIKKLFDILE
jgi:protein-arginine kinase activator protein McsA